MVERRPSGLRERHKRRTREALRDAALARILRDGFDAATVEDIAADCEVSPRTFFRYYPSKVDVVVAPYVELFDRWEALVRAAPPGQTLLDTLKDASHLVTDAYERDAEFWDRHHEAVTGDPALGLRLLQTQARLQQRAAAAIGARLGLDAATDLRPGVVAAAAMAGVNAAVARWYANGRRGDRRALVDAAHDEVAAATSLLLRPLPDLPVGDEPDLEAPPSVSVSGVTGSPGGA